LDARQVEVVDVRYDAGRFGSGYKDRPKSDASIRAVPMAEPVAAAMARRLDGCGRDELVFCGPGGSNGAPRGARSHLSVGNYRRVYRLAVARAELPELDPHGPHDLRHTFATWLEDAGIPSRVIDELMGHTGGRRGQSGVDSPMGRIYRETTPLMLARVTAALDERMARQRQLPETRRATPRDGQGLRLDKSPALPVAARENFLYTIKAGPAGGRPSASLVATPRPPIEASGIGGTRMAGGPAWASRPISGRSLRRGQPSSLSVPCSCS
jgi:Phage integrase family